MSADDDQIEGRRAALEAILRSDARQKLIVAGPGTGKTYTFQRVLESVEGRGLAITFLLSLVADLDQEIGSSTDVYSFHGFSRRLLHQIDGTGVTKGVEYYPPCTELYVEDIRIVDGVIIESSLIGKSLRNLAADDPRVKQVLASGAYYDCVSHDDAVFRVLSALQDDPDKIPGYPQVVVDEFQDFCPMEVQFVEALAKRNPMLIVGDDDQALYAFRDATPQSIRDLAVGAEYQRFDLPYCTRCTEVIVLSTHTVVDQARRAGLLQGRLEKPYECFMPDKRPDSEAFPSVVHAKCSVQSKKAPYMSRYVAQEVARISPEDVAESYEKRFPTVLIIGPQPFLGQIEEYLRRDFRNVKSRSSKQPELDLLTAYRLLVTDDVSNLGWRILLQILRPDAWEESVRGGLASGERLREFLTEEFIEGQLKIVSIMDQVGKGLELTADERDIVADALSIPVSDLDDTLHPPKKQDEVVDESEPLIMLTSLMGSKGLQAAHVFVVGINDGHFPQRNSAITNEEVCQLLVALTRTRKSCTLVSTGRFAGDWKRKSRFIDWLAPHLEERSIDKEYFKSHL